MTTPSLQPSIPAGNRADLGDRVVPVVMSSSRMRLALVDGFASHQECVELIALSLPTLSRSQVTLGADGAEATHPARDSDGTRHANDSAPLIAAMVARAAALVGLPVEHAEPLGTLRYQNLQRYLPHLDWFSSADEAGQFQLDQHGQRLASVIIYLSDVEEGGSTAFPFLGLDVRAREGSAICFANVGATGTPLREALHSGEPVVSGSKFVATLWFRDRPYVSRGSAAP